MRTDGTLLLYLLVGLAVGATLAWRDPRRWALWLTLGVLFWPLFLPLLFPKPRPPKPTFIDELEGLRGEALRLAPQLPELGALPDVLVQAARIRSGKEDLDRLFETEGAALAADEPALARTEKTRAIRESRVADLERIRGARDEQDARYLQSVSRVREVITLAHLARYSPDSRRDLEKQLALLQDEMDLLDPASRRKVQTG